MYTGYDVDRYQNPPLYINRPKEIEKWKRKKRQYNVPPPMITSTDTPNDFISAFQDYLRQPDIVNNSVFGLLINSWDFASAMPWFTNTINASPEQ